MARISIDVSADIGEVPGDEGRQLDASLIAEVSTAHIAAGGHAGDTATMTASVAACVASGTRIGCHPSYVDREGFGRLPVNLAPQDVAEQVALQVASLDAVARRAGGRVESIKPHGQLYHDLATDEHLLHELCSVLDEQLLVVLPAGSAGVAAIARGGRRAVAEGFCDRRYSLDGTLVARSDPAAILSSPTQAAAQSLALAQRGVVAGRHVARVDSLCVHSDSPGVLATLRAVKAALESASIEVAPVPLRR